jgi:antitoxin PrlF
MANNVTSKGQVTIPKNVRDRLGIAAGSAVAFELTDTGEVVLRAVGRRPARAPKDGPRSGCGPRRSSR